MKGVKKIWLQEVKPGPGEELAPPKHKTRYRVDAEKTIREIAYLAYSNMKDYIKVDQSGGVSFDFRNLDAAKAAAIQELNIEEYKLEDGTTTRRIRFKLYDKGQNLERLAKHLGIFVEKTDVNINLGGLASELRNLLRVDQRSAEDLIEAAELLEAEPPQLTP